MLKDRGRAALGRSNASGQPPPPPVLLLLLLLPPLLAPPPSPVLLVLVLVLALRMVAMKVSLGTLKLCSRRPSRCAGLPSQMMTEPSVKDGMNEEVGVDSVLVSDVGSDMAGCLRRGGGEERLLRYHVWMRSGTVSREAASWTGLSVGRPDAEQVSTHAPRHRQIWTSPHALHAPAPPRAGTPGEIHRKGKAGQCCTADEDIADWHPSLRAGWVGVRKLLPSWMWQPGGPLQYSGPDRPSMPSVEAPDAAAARQSS